MSLYPERPIGMAPMRVRRGSQSRSTARYALAKSIAKMEGRVNGWMVGWLDGIGW